MTPQERKAAFARQREITASALRTHRTANVARGVSLAVSAPCFGAFALIIRWHDWPWLALPVAVSLGAAFACREAQKRALARHRRTCRDLGVT